MNPLSSGHAVQGPATVRSAIPTTSTDRPARPSRHHDPSPRTPGRTDDHHGVDAVVRASDADWTLVRAVALTDKPSGGPLRAALAGDGKPGTFVSRDGLAAFLLDCVEQDSWIRQTPLAWNASR